jgi:DNA-binding helix-hairpin-helix protein with protein kinase domain
VTGGAGEGSLSGLTVRMVRGGSSVLIGRRIGEGGQGVVHEAMVGTTRLAVKWLRPGPRTGLMRHAIADLAARESPHHAFAWPIDVLESDRIGGFGYLMRLLDLRFVSFAAMLNQRQQPSFRALVEIGRQLVEPFAALHAAGLCYRDISFGNLYVDPQRAEVAIIDNDNAGVDGGEVFVKGTPRFMAPEIVRDEALPSTVTDLYSLAVFLFHLFVHGHPLEGCRTEASYNWSEDRVSETALALRHYGFDPVFVFDPDDASNRPVPGDPMLTWWRIYPRFFRDLFERMFTTGLGDASLAGRVPEGVWRRALSRLADCVSQCPECQAATFWDPDDPELSCWNCGVVPPPPPLLVVPGHRLVLAEGAVVTSQHLTRDRNGRQLAATVEAHPHKPGSVVLRNCTDRRWTVVPVGEEAKAVDPERRLAVRPMTIDFGVARGAIQYAPAAEGR